MMLMLATGSFIALLLGLMLLWMFTQIPDSNVQFGNHSFKSRIRSTLIRSSSSNSCIHNSNTSDHNNNKTSDHNNNNNSSSSNNNNNNDDYF
mmetsp:Transcript_51310/g.109074  ORF Transcript_51310/g.109074 Transcript_51310/m.109074 type:complete len:92 (-) Transcript_51310:298-573(-)